MLPEVKLAIAFTVLFVTSIYLYWEYIRLSSLFLYVGVAVPAVRTFVTDTPPVKLLWAVCFVAGGFPVYYWIRSIVLCVNLWNVTDFGSNKPGVVRGARSQKRPQNELRFKVGKDGTLLLAGLLHQKMVRINPSVLVSAGRGENASWAFLCYRCRRGERTESWEKSRAAGIGAKGVTTDGKTAYFDGKYARVKVTIAAVASESFRSRSKVPRESISFSIQSNCCAGTDLPASPIFLKSARLDMRLTDLVDKDTSVLQNGFGTFARGVTVPNGHVLFQPISNFPVWRFFIGGIGINVDSPFFMRFERGIYSDHYIGIQAGATGLESVFCGYTSQLVGLGTFFYHGASGTLTCDLEYGKIVDGSPFQTERMLISTDPITTPFLESFAESVADTHNVRFRTRAISTDAHSVPLGWCSWYEFYADVTEEKVMRNVSYLSKRNDLQVDFIQLDDGYQKHLGDWLDVNEEKFPSGLEDLARNIRARGFQAGIWVAPFLAGARSKVFRAHKKDWFVRAKGIREDGIASYAFNTIRFPGDCFTAPHLIGHFNPEWQSDLGVEYILDFTHPEVQEYVSNIFRTLKRYGFEYFKIDFLTAGIREGHRHDNTKSRLEVYRDSLKLIRQAIGDDAFLLGCGAPLGPSVGLVDALRVSGDIKELWAPSLLECIASGMSLNVPSIKHSLLMNIRRNFLHNIWWLNDPDCLLVREDSRFSLTETKTAISILGLTGGIMLLSDDMTKLAPERLELVKKVLPPSTMVKGRPGSVMEHTYPNHFFCKGFVPGRSPDVHAFINWADEPFCRSIVEYFENDIGGYYLWDYWREALISSPDSLQFDVHETRVVLASLRSPVPSLVGNTLNILAQADGRIQVTDWSATEKNLVIAVSDVASTSGSLFIAVPGQMFAFKSVKGAEFISSTAACVQKSNDTATIVKVEILETHFRNSRATVTLNFV